MGISLSGITESSTGNLTVHSAAGSAILMGDATTLLSLDGSLGTGQIGILGIANSNNAIYIAPAATTSGANATWNWMQLGGGSGVTVPSGTTSHVATLNLEEPNITATGTVTVGTTLRIVSAPTEGTNNYALWVDAGAVRFDDRTFSVGGVNYEFPASVNAGTYLKTDGSGNLSWAAATATATGSGTTGKLTKWTDGGAGSIGDSIIAESGSTITVTGSIAATSHLQLNDNAQLQLGTSSDSILFFNGADTYWNLKSVGSGGLMLALAGSFPAPDNDMVHIWKGDAGNGGGAVTATGNSLLVLENTGDIALQFLSGNGTSQLIRFGDAPSGNNAAATFGYDHGNQRFRLATELANRLYISATGLTFVDATVISTSAGNLTLNANTASDVLLGDNVTLLRVDGGADSVVLTGNSTGANNVNTTLDIQAPGSGDPVITFTGAGTSVDWHIGVDNNTEDFFNIGSGTTVGAGQWLTFDPRITTAGHNLMRFLTSPGTITSASASNNVARAFNFGGLTVNYTGTTQVTDTGGWAQFNAPTLAGNTATLTVDKYATIETAAVIEGTNVLLTDAIAIRIKNTTGTPANQYGLYIDNLTVGTTADYAIYTADSTQSYFGGPVGIRATTDSAVLNLGGTFQGASFTSAVRVTTALTDPDANNTNAAGVYIATNFTEVANRSTPIRASLRVVLPTITAASGASVTDSATVYISGAPTGGATPTNGHKALLVAGGTSYFGGDVNIGTTSNYPLHVRSTVANRGIKTDTATSTHVAQVLVENTVANAANHAELKFSLGASSGDGRIIFDTSADPIWTMGVKNSDSSFRFQSTAGAGLDTPDLTISAAGNVGIGDTSPEAKLKIFGVAAVDENALYVMHDGEAASGSEARTVVKFEHVAKGGSQTTSGEMTTVQIRTAPNTSTGNDLNGEVIGLKMDFPWTSASGGVIGSGYNIKLNAPTNSSSGTMTNFYQLYIGDANAATATNEYGIYQAGATDKNYFAGSTGIGAADPAQLLELRNTTANGNAIIRLRAEADSSGISGIEWYEGQYHRWRISRTGVNGNLSIDRSTDGSSWHGLPAITILKADGKVGINTGTTVVDQLHIAATKNSMTEPYAGGLRIDDDTAVATGVGGLIAFYGKYSGDTKTTLATIHASKEDGTSQYEGNLVFATRVQGAGSTEKMRIKHDGEVDISTGGLTITKTGTTVPTTLHLKNLQAKANGVGSGIYFTGHSSGQSMGYIFTRWDQSSGGSAADSTEMAFYTRNASNSLDERMTILGGGNVGIGNTNPGVGLVLANSSAVFTTSHDTIDSTIVWANPPIYHEGIYISFDAANNRGRIASIHPSVAYRELSIVGSSLYFNIVGTIQAMEINSSGNVGIGNMAGSIDAQFHVQSASANVARFESAAAYGFTSGSGVANFVSTKARVNPASSQEGPYIAFHQMADNTMRDVGFLGTVASSTYSSTATDAVNQDHDMVLGVRAQNGSLAEKMRIRYDGKVGIGTGSNIDQLLHIQSSGTTAYMQIESSGNTGWIGFGGNNNLNLGVTGSNDLNIYTAGTERIIIDSGGNVGIGTDTSPNYKLDVQGTGRFDSTLSVGGTLTGAAASFSSLDISGGPSIDGTDIDMNSHPITELASTSSDASANAVSNIQARRYAYAFSS